LVAWDIILVLVDRAVFSVDQPRYLVVRCFGFFYFALFCNKNVVLNVRF
jgi:hypothetical protein